jgi:hypothetical protein
MHDSAAVAELERQVRGLRRQLDQLARCVTASVGIEAHRLYSKEQFLAALGREARVWHRLLKESGFKDLVRYANAKSPYIYGSDYINWLKARASTEIQESDECLGSCPTQR